MSASKLRIKVIEEIQRVPEHKLIELYDVIHFFRVGVETATATPKDIMQFAGCWQDMPEEEFEDFLDEITDRRQQAFTGRTQRETLIS
jgi:hypothetical protein